MRHQKSGYHLSRTRAHRKALLSNLSAALFERKRIRTTLTKAKAARSVVEKYITFAKKGDLASRRHVLRYIPRPGIVKMLFEEIAPKYAERAGGYSRIVKLGQRQGDGAPMAILELVGFESTVTAKKAATKKKAEKAPEEGVKDETQAKETKPRKTTRRPAARKAKSQVEEVAVAETASEISEPGKTTEATGAEEMPKKSKEKKSKKK